MTTAPTSQTMRLMEISLSRADAQRRSVGAAERALPIALTLGARARRIGTPLRIGADDDTSLTVPVIAWQRPEYFLAAVRGGASVEARRTGPRGCDMPPAPGP